MILQKKALSSIKKRECLKGATRGKLLEWTHERVDKTSEKTINETYAEYKQRQLNESGEKNRKVLGKHVISLYLSGISQVVKIMVLKKLQQDIENDPIIGDQIAMRMIQSSETKLLT